MLANDCRLMRLPVHSMELSLNKKKKETTCLFISIGSASILFTICRKLPLSVSGPPLYISLDLCLYHSPSVPFTSTFTLLPGACLSCHILSHAHNDFHDIIILISLQLSTSNHHYIHTHSSSAQCTLCIHIFLRERVSAFS